MNNFDRELLEVRAQDDEGEKDDETGGDDDAGGDDEDGDDENLD